MQVNSPANIHSVLDTRTTSGTRISREQYKLSCLRSSGSDDCILELVSLSLRTGLNNEAAHEQSDSKDRFRNIRKSLTVSDQTGSPFKPASVISSI